jgi:hypothetical protein
MEISPQSTLTDFRALLPSIRLSYLVGVTALCKYVEMTVWRTFLKVEAPQNNHYCQQQAVTPDPGISNLKKSAPKCHHYLQRAGWAVLPSENVSQRFFQGEKNTVRIKIAVYF